MPKFAVIIVSIIFVLLFIALLRVQNELPPGQQHALQQKPKTLCDARLNCEQNEKKKIPKGVCIPGGMCT